MAYARKWGEVVNDHQADWREACCASGRQAFPSAALRKDCVGTMEPCPGGCTLMGSALGFGILEAPDGAKN
jgi:hypothetical protein